MMFWEICDNCNTIWKYIFDSHSYSFAVFTYIHKVGKVDENAKFQASKIRAVIFFSFLNS